MASPLHLDMSASKTKKITGTISLSEVSPGADAESSVIFKKTVTDESFLKASSALRDLVLEKMKSFEMEFKTMWDLRWQIVALGTPHPNAPQSTAAP